jgi:GNAT superfamily N-acetyltransferase
MPVRPLTDVGRALNDLRAPLHASGGEGELTLGLLSSLSRDPGRWGPLTMLVDDAADGPAAFVMMTGDHPALVTGFAPEGRIGFEALAAAMLGAGLRPSGVNGARRCSEALAAAFAGAGARSDVRREMRAFQLREVRPPAMPDGAFRVAGSGDAPVLERWTVEFCAEIGEPVDEDEAGHAVAELTAAEDLVVWERGGEMVSMAAVNRRTAWSSNVAYVYTPPGLRGRGYASAAVAALSQRELDAGAEWCCLFTDLANPTSNHIYAAIGYEPVCDYRHIGLTW